MLRWSIPASLAVLAAIPLAGAARQRATDGRAAAHLAREIAAAEARGDVKFLATAWAPDYTEINQFGVVRTKAERLAGMRVKETVFQSIRVLEDNVRAYGDTAVVALRLAVKGTVRGKPIDGEVRALNVFVKRGHRWQAVATQYTRVTGR